MAGATESVNSEYFAAFPKLRRHTNRQTKCSVLQIGAANWLMADRTTGALMTELKGSGRFGQPLISDALIIGGNWHRVGLTWDGSNKIRYVDDVEAAKDTQSSLTGSEGALYMGTGKDRESGSFFSGSGSALRRDESGLIDDVRISSQAIVP